MWRDLEVSVAEQQLGQMPSSSWSNSKRESTETHTSGVCILFHQCVAWQIVKTYRKLENLYLHQQLRLSMGNSSQKWGYKVWMQEGMHVSFEQDPQRSGELAARRKTHLQRWLCVRMWWVAVRDGSPFKSRSGVNPQRVHISRIKRGEGRGMMNVGQVSKEDSSLVHSRQQKK